MLQNLDLGAMPLTISGGKVKPNFGKIFDHYLLKLFYFLQNKSGVLYHFILNLVNLIVTI